MTDQIVKAASRKSGVGRSIKAISVEAVEASVRAEFQRQQTQGTRAIVASPYAASMIAEEAQRSNSEKKIDVVALFPDSHTQNTGLIHGIAYDYDNAYIKMATQSIQALKAKTRKNKNAVAIAIVFQENFMRPAQALDAFVDTVSKTLGRERIRVETLSSMGTQIDITGSINQAIERISSPDVGVIVLAIDEAYLARSKSLSDRTRTYISDETCWQYKESWRSRSNFGYRILGNEGGIVSAVREALENIAAQKPIKGMRLVRPKSTRLPGGIF